MLFPWYIKYPNQNDEILNLDWILSTIDNLVNEVANFVSLNTIKYADPIQWNITTQYEKNTVVIDPISGSAYISTKPIPAGVGLNNKDYWSIIFTIDVISANKNLTLRDDANNMLATFESDEDDWLLWQGTLYIVTNSIEIGQAYVDGYNIERYTVEMFLKDYISNLKNYVDDTIGSLSNLTTEDKTNVVAAINEIVGIIGSLDDLSTSDKDSIVDAINKVVGIIGSLDDLSTSDKDSIVNAINEIYNIANGNSTNIGNLSDLDTTDKSNLVDAINELVDNTDYIIVASKNGAVGDGVTDDTAIIQSLINLSGSTGKPLFLDKTFKVTSLTITNGCEIFGTAGNTGYNKANIIASGNITIPRSTGSNTILHNLTLQGNGTNFIINHAVNVKIRDCDIWHLGSGNCIISYGALLSITGCTFTCNDDYAIELDIENTEVNINIYIDGNTFGGSCSLMRIKSSVAGSRPEGIVFSNNNTMNTGGEAFNISSVYSLIISGNTLDQIGSTVLFLNQVTDVINDIQLINNYIGMVGSNPNPIVTIGTINNLTIRDNHWTGCQRIAILESGATDIVISGNMLDSDGIDYPAIIVNSSKNVIIANNIIKKTGVDAIAIQAVNATGLSKVIILGNIIKGTISLAGYNASNSVNANNIAL